MHQLIYQFFIFRGLLAIIFWFLLGDHHPVLGVLSLSIAKELGEVLVFVGWQRFTADWRRDVAASTVCGIWLEVLQKLQVLSVHFWVHILVG